MWRPQRQWSKGNMVERNPVNEKSAPPSYHEALTIVSVPGAMVKDEVVAKLVAMGFTARSDALIPFNFCLSIYIFLFLQCCIYQNRTSVNVQAYMRNPNMKTYTPCLSCGFPTAAAHNHPTTLFVPPCHPLSLPPCKQPDQGRRCSPPWRLSVSNRGLLARDRRRSSGSES